MKMLVTGTAWPGENQIIGDLTHSLLEINLMKQTSSRLPEDNIAKEFRRALTKTIHLKHFFL